jgi:putative transposase
MAYRTIQLDWTPRSRSAWRIFTAARLEAARLWGDLIARHHRLRRLGWRWPSKPRWQAWAKRKYPNLHSQSVQQIIAEFCEAVDATRQLRKNGQSQARYPWRKPRYRDVIYTNQAVRLRDRHVLLPCGAAGVLRIRLLFELAGRLIEARLCLGHVLLICARPDAPQPPQTVIGVDLGVNTLLAATDGHKAILVSGRAAKATVQWRNKRLASIQQRQSRHTKGSGRWKRQQRRKARMLQKAANRMRDLTHKATRKVVDAFPGATCYIGKPFNDASQKLGRKQAQQVSSAANAKMIAQLEYKSAGAIEVDEAYTSQTCPECGRRAKGRRLYCCRACGCSAPRDLIGSTNIRSVGMFGKLQTGCAVPNSVHFVYPSKDPGRSPGSSGGHPAGSSRQREAHPL